MDGSSSSSPFSSRSLFTPIASRLASASNSCASSSSAKSSSSDESSFSKCTGAATSTATAAAISADGSHIAVRTYTDAWIWTRGEESVEAALGGQPCRLRLDMEPQGEAIAWDGLDLLTVSEGAGSPFLRYRAVEEVGP